MDGLSLRFGAWAARLHWLCLTALRRVLRRFGGGVIGLALGLLALLLVLLWGHAQASRADAARAVLRELNERQQAQAAFRQQRVAPDAGRAALTDFAGALLPHEDIPAAVQALLHAAEAEGLVLARGDYRLQPDVAGRFLRYQMSLPVQGPADAIHRFMAQALREQPMLALASVHFQRETGASSKVEARIQWMLFAQLPGAGELPLDERPACPSGLEASGRELGQPCGNPEPDGGVAP